MANTNAMRNLDFGLAKTLVLVLAVSALTGCGGIVGLGNPADKNDTLVVRSATDEVKLIAFGLTDGRDTTSLQSASYTIAADSRLLVRLSSLKSSAPQILQQQPILFRVQLAADQNEATVRTGLQICPLEKNWMMLATWTKAHPYKAGSWRNPGGDYLPENCLGPLPANHADIASGDEAQFCGPKGTLCFDLQNWVQAQVRERGLDNGFILVFEGESGVRIQGDATSSGPTVFWRKLRF